MIESRAARKVSSISPSAASCSPSASCCISRTKERTFGMKRSSQSLSFSLPRSRRRPSHERLTQCLCSTLSLYCSIIRERKPLFPLRITADIAAALPIVARRNGGRRGETRVLYMYRRGQRDSRNIATVVARPRITREKLQIERRAAFDLSFSSVVLAFTAARFKSKIDPHRGLRNNCYTYNVA